MAFQNVVTVEHPVSLNQALGSASSGLPRVAVELGAEAVVVLLLSSGRIEISYFWSEAGDKAPGSPFTEAMDLETLRTHSGAVSAHTPFAQLLRRWISQRSRSFLLVPWQVRDQVVAVVFGFASLEPRYHQVPDAVRERLDLIGLATWSVQEIARLRAELKTVTSRLAGRKLVERAKSVLQIDQGITEERAYEYLRRLSRQRRITLAALAEEVVRGHGGRDLSRLSATELEIAP
jgi:hypothetical protein